MSEYWDKWWARKRASRRQVLGTSMALGAGAAGLALVGCGDDDDDDDDDVTTPAPGSPTTTTGETPSTAETPTTGETPSTGAHTPTGQIRMALVTLADQSTDPHRQTAGNNMPIVDSCFEQLMRRDREGNLVSALAESLEESEDHTQFVVTLRPDATFWDGSPVTSEDVKWSFERMTTLDPPPPGAADLLRWVGGIDTPDERTAVINIAEPSPLRLRGSVISPQGWNIASRAHHEAVGEDEFVRRPMGTGPFQVVENEVQAFTRLEAYAGHYERVPYIQSIEMRIVPEQTTRLAQLQTGEADFADGIHGPARQQVIDDDSLEVYEVPTTAMTVMHFHSIDQPPYNDIRFRMALRLAISHEELISGLLGVGEPAPPVHGVFPVTPGYDADVLQPWEQDIEQARALLSEAGLENTSIRVFGYDSSSTPLIPQTIEAIVGMWRNVGIDASIEIREAASHFEAWRARELTDLAALSTPSWFVAESLLLTHFRSAGAYASVNDPEMESRIEEILTNFDEESQRQQLTDLFAYVQEQAYHVSFPYVTSSWGVNAERIANWEPADSVPYPNSFWTLRLVEA